MPPDPRRAKELFVAAFDLPLQERAAFLDRECGADAALRARVVELLSAHDDSPTADDPPGTVIRDPDRTLDPGPVGEAGQLVGGRYRLVQPIGEGGMGSVWVAEQREPVKRLVAVKLIKAGMDSKAVLARFDAERQALAVMDHPNIARVFDGGVTADSRPYFVMELVKGTPITAFCDARRLTPRQRLELFVPVCGAIQHAHMKGVIHRDIKPSNVLVALYDDTAVPKVIDFGVAKAAGQTLTDKTLITGFGAVVGTPEYMSPEQASLNNLDIDTRSDVYSLGVLLYELLTGSPPFTKGDLEKAGLLEMLRVVREVEPPRPSVKLSTAAAKPSIAANRGTEPSALGRLLRTELDWLVMKALEKDRNRRYDSANGFAADVQRYLAGEAVQAVPPSLGYRVRKWVRRNRGLVTAAGLVAGTFAVGLTGTTWGLIRAEEEADRVRKEQSKTKDALDQAERNREEAEVTLVRSYLRPIGFNTKGVDEAEMIALNELARQDDRIKWLFLQESLADVEQALRTARRSSRVVQAAVGTSLKRRERMLNLVSGKQRDVTADPRVRLAACLLAVQLGSDHLPALGEVVDTLLKGKDSDWGNFLAELPMRIHPNCVTQFADVLAALLGKTTDANAIRAAEHALSALAPRLDAVAAGKGFDALVAVIGKATDARVLQAAVTGLSALAPRLDAATAADKLARAADALVALLGKATDDTVFWPIDPSVYGAAGEGLSVLAPWLDAAAAGRGFDALVVLLGKATDPSVLQAPWNALSALAPRLDTAAAGRGFDALVALLEKSADPSVLRAAGKALSVLAPRVDAAAAGKGFDTLVSALRKAVDPEAIEAAEAGLSALAPRVDAAAAGRGADALVALLGKATHPHALWAAGKALSALAPRLDTAAAGLGFDALVAVIGKAHEITPLEAAGEGLSALAPRLDAAAVGKGFGALVAVIGRTTNPSALRAAGAGLSALAPRLDAAAAGKGFDTLVAVIGTTYDGSRLQTIAYGLSALAPRLDTAAAADKLAHAADALVAVVGRRVDTLVLRAAGEGLSALAPRLDTAAAADKLARVADALVTALRNATNPHVLRVVGEGLSALAPRLEAAAAGRGFDALVAALGRATDADAIEAAANALSALAPRLDAATAVDKLAHAANAVEAIDTRTLDRRVANAVDATLLALLARQPEADRDSRIRRLIRRVMGYSWSRLEGGRPLVDYRGRPSVLAKAVSLQTSFPFLTEVLADPICVGDFQTFVLIRLERLAYPEPTHAAVFAGLAAVPHRTLTLPVLQIANGERKLSDRRFRTVSDAARWLGEHHPEIDLDKPYHKFRPGD